MWENRFEVRDTPRGLEKEYQTLRLSSRHLRQFQSREIDATDNIRRIAMGGWIVSELVHQILPFGGKGEGLGLWAPSSAPPRSGLPMKSLPASLPRPFDIEHAGSRADEKTRHCARIEDDETQPEGSTSRGPLV
jgi:hypothetical protein